MLIKIIILIMEELSMVKVYKFYFFNWEGKMIEDIFETEEDGFEFGENYELDFFKHQSYYVEGSINR
jgi:hypothetical protein